jgi:proteasome lid subunit RPN8/RPN11
MNIIEDEYQKIIEFYPNAILEDARISQVKIPLKDKFFLKINFKNYPKKPIVNLISKDDRVYRKVDKIIPLLNRWEKKNPPSIVDLINEILTFINNLDSKEIKIKKELLNGLFALCKNQHPREILGLLRIINGIAIEYILPPGAITSNTSGIFIPSRLGFDSTLKGSIHSHPSGNPNPSLTDINSVFKTKQFNFIIAHPYDTRNIKCFDNNGREIEFRILD